MSLEAKGLILYILETKDDNYELSLHDLCIAHSCSQQKLERIIDELQRFGYIDYELIKHDSGKIDGKFTIYDSPHNITMIRYDYKRDFEKSLSRAEKDFIKTYLNVNRRKKRDQKISSYKIFFRSRKFFLKIFFILVPHHSYIMRRIINCKLSIYSSRFSFD